jgi:hypothetical protein
LAIRIGQHPDLTAADVIGLLERSPEKVSTLWVLTWIEPIIRHLGHRADFLPVFDRLLQRGYVKRVGHVRHFTGQGAARLLNAVMTSVNLDELDLSFVLVVTAEAAATRDGLELLTRLLANDLRSARLMARRLLEADIMMGRCHPAAVQAEILCRMARADLSGERRDELLRLMGEPFLQASPSAPPPDGGTRARVRPMRAPPPGHPRA